MRSEPGSKSRKEEVKREESTRKHRPGVARIGSPPQLNFDPQKRKDYFNRLLEKYSEKTTKFESSTSNYTPQNDRFPLLPPTKIVTKLKEKASRRKKSNSDRTAVKTTPVVESDAEDGWKESVRCHVMNDLTCYKNHYRVKNKYPYPMKTIAERDETSSSSEESADNLSAEESKLSKPCHDLTLLPSGDQINGRKSVKVSYEKISGVDSLPEEVQSRHLTRTQSGTLMWVGNDSLNSAVKMKIPNKDPSGKEALRRDVKSEQSLEGTTATAKRSVKTKRTAPRKTLLPQPNEESKIVKKVNEKLKKAKKLSKKPSITLVTSKASA